MHYDIVIVGGGAGGLELAAQLGRALGRKRGRERVLLIDRAVFHIWKPTLHEVAAGTLDTHQEGLSYAILARRNHFSFALGELEGLDPEAKRLTLKEIRDKDGELIVPARAISFTWTVLAIGSGSNFFGTPGAAEHAYVLEQTEDAERFHTRLLSAFTRASFTEAGALNIAIVGGGATGVELSAELLEAHTELLQSLGPSQRFRLGLTLVEAADRILGGLPEKISEQATLTLQRRGVRVLTGAKVQEVAACGLATSAGPIPADLVVWAAGVKAADSNAGLGLAVTRSNQFQVDDHLQTSAPGVFALGDCAACPWRDGKLVPARAQAAHQQASYLRKVLLAKLREGHVAEPYAYRDFGSLVSLGENRGVGSLMGNLGGKNFFVEGLIAKYMYISLHLAHHRAILGFWQTVVLALARLLQERVSGRLKLH
ncbi:NAD(P)/FAD-dependent oxidoreductase [Phenylobacterium montanum]|uniref:FAD-dependent oxidoreductase n=1 Tax=Phenylobacterium montanum TaxID=2823693 RepID=A0A975G258_9CAUL|nr:FAD-dependent oxidoreductase [Caulobacter sp. S6]QUD89112.1 FAD-dependent oxidoreductase [Caulobacter sp. S6]